jgi:hypothetical protein
MLTRTPSPQHQEKDWFTFSAGLMIHVSSDYMTMRLLHYLEPLTGAPTICATMLDIAEKSLKLHLAVQTQSTTALADIGTTYGHNIEALREACAAFTPVFAEDDVRAFTKDLNDRDGKLYHPMELATLVDRTNELYSGHAILLDGSA